MKVVVFLGPSLPVEEAREILDAIYLPPVEQAHLVSAVTTHRPDVVGIVDGLFGQALSVWHKEILHALHEGVAVFGASSMGALRAAETEAFGTIGVGEIFRMYRDREIEDDDEVALVHGDPGSGYPKLSEPMVNLRATFRRAVELGRMDEPARERWTRISKSLFYPERTIPRILRAASLEGVAEAEIERVRAILRDDYVDLKRQDAIAMLEAIRDLPPGFRHDPAPGGERRFDFTRSQLFESLYHRDRSVRREEGEVTLADIANHAALHMPDFMAENQAAIRRALCLTLADQLDVQAPEGSAESEKSRFMARMGIGGGKALEAWIARNDLTRPEFDALMTEEARLRVLHRWLLTRNHLVRGAKILLDHLRLHGRYEEWADRAARHEWLFRKRFPFFLETGDDDISMRELLADHFAGTPCRMDTDFVAWSEEAGFHDVADMRYEMIRARMIREYMRSLSGMAAGLADAFGGEDDSEDGEEIVGQASSLSEPPPAGGE